jgi:hypothetical protein
LWLRLLLLLLLLLVVVLVVLLLPKQLVLVLLPKKPARTKTHSLCGTWSLLGSPEALDASAWQLQRLLKDGEGI